MIPHAEPLSLRHYDRLAVVVHADRAALGRAAAISAARTIADTIASRGEARVVFACAPSQDEFLAALLNPTACGSVIDWSRVRVFHMDEYVALPATHSASFRAYLREHLVRHVPTCDFHPLNADSPDLQAVCRTYATALAAKPIDLICMGVGENGHIAFNDPPVADFNDKVLVKVVELDLACRQQQVNDGCFAHLDDVPRHALTLTVPVFRHALRLSVHVPGPRKATAVRRALTGPIETLCPASILRQHPAAVLHLDRESAAQL